MLKFTRIIVIGDCNYQVVIEPVSYNIEYSVHVYTDKITSNYIALFNGITDVITEFVETNNDFKYLSFHAIDDKTQFAPKKSKYFKLIGDKVAERTNKIIFNDNQSKLVSYIKIT